MYRLYCYRGGEGGSPGFSTIAYEIIPLENIVFVVHINTLGRDELLIVEDLTTIVNIVTEFSVFF